MLRKKNIRVTSTRWTRLKYEEVAYIWCGNIISPTSSTFVWILLLLETRNHPATWTTICPSKIEKTMPHISVVLRTRDLNVSRQVDKPLIYAETGKLRTLHIVSYCLGICNEWIVFIWVRVIFLCTFMVTQRSGPKRAYPLWLEHDYEELRHLKSNLEYKLDCQMWNQRFEIQ